MKFWRGVSGRALAGAGDTFLVGRLALGARWIGRLAASSSLGSGSRVMRVGVVGWLSGWLTGALWGAAVAHRGRRMAAVTLVCLRAGTPARTASCGAPTMASRARPRSARNAWVEVGSLSAIKPGAEDGEQVDQGGDGDAGDADDGRGDEQGHSEAGQGGRQADGRGAQHGGPLEFGRREDVGGDLYEGDQVEDG